MTLDEAIKHCEEVAEKYCDAVEEGLRPDDFCDSCASEHRQLAKWLKELKEFKVLFVKANRDVGNVHLDNRAIFEKFFWEVWKIFDVKGLEEVNADADSD